MFVNKVFIQPYGMTGIFGEAGFIPTYEKPPQRGCNFSWVLFIDAELALREPFLN
ncbi:hypothetical protein [Undibacterium sp. TJN19]|uniref:hypothetical protein n=1 Tax=Undibacterium sp. TJN19 TaxID=3413055 RepID=UPI003BEF7356